MLNLIEASNKVLQLFQNDETRNLNEVADRAVRKARKVMSHEENDENPMDEAISAGVSLVFWIIVGCALAFGFVIFLIRKFIPQN